MSPEQASRSLLAITPWLDNPNNCNALAHLYDEEAGNVLACLKLLKDVSKEGYINYARSLLGINISLADQINFQKLIDFSNMTQPLLEVLRAQHEVNPRLLSADSFEYLTRNLNFQEEQNTLRDKSSIIQVLRRNPELMTRDNIASILSSYFNMTLISVLERICRAEPAIINQAILQALFNLGGRRLEERTRRRGISIEMTESIRISAVDMGIFHLRRALMTRDNIQRLIDVTSAVENVMYGGVEELHSDDLIRSDTQRLERLAPLLRTAQPLTDEDAGGLLPEVLNNATNRRAIVIYAESQLISWQNVWGLLRQTIDWAFARFNTTGLLTNENAQQNFDYIMARGIGVMARAFYNLQNTDTLTGDQAQTNFNELIAAEGANLNGVVARLGAANIRPTSAQGVTVTPTTAAEATTGFAWNPHMERGGTRVDIPPEGGYSSILTQALEKGVVSQQEIDDIDSRYLCGITQQIIDNPVYDITTGGQNHGGRFDRTALTLWLQQKSTNPETRQATTINNLQEDAELSKEIEEVMQGIMTRMTLDRRPNCP